MRPTGLLPSPEDYRDHDFAHTSLFGAGMGKRKSILDTLEIHVDRIQFHQNCTGYSTMQSIQDWDLQLTRLKAPVFTGFIDEDGKLKIDDITSTRLNPLPPLSGMSNYTGGRRLWYRLNDIAIPPDGIPDAGSSYRHNIMWERDVENGGGLRAEDEWPDTDENVNRIPPARVDQRPPLVAVKQYARIKNENGVDILRESIYSALEGFRAGRCGKPMTSLTVGEGVANTVEGDVYDSSKPGKIWGGHAMLVGGYDADQDAAILHHTRYGAKTLRVRIADLTGESWVHNGLIYVNP